MTIWTTIFINLSKLCKILPIHLALHFGSAIGLLFYAVIPIRKNVARKNIELCFPSESDKWKKRVLKGMYKHIGRTLFFGLKSQFLDQQRLQSLIQDFELLQECIKDNCKGIIFISAHFGLWEIIPLLFRNFSNEKVVVYKELHDKSMEEFVANIRSKSGVTLIKDKGSMSELQQVLQRGGMIGLVTDQRPTSKHSVKVKFFGQEVSSFSGFALLHQRVLSPIWFIALIEEKKQCDKPFKLIVKNITPTNGIDIGNLVQTYYSILEELVILYPEQYYWIHDRFKSSE